MTLLMMTAGRAGCGGGGQEEHLCPTMNYNCLIKHSGREVHPNLAHKHSSLQP